ncbi:MAG TPA: acetolactate synthase, partial [Saccharofermentans sp.]|nr:acetolactate synthase [Saccharofermentans sp.]
LALLTTNNISLEYLYAFVGRSSTDAVVVIRVDDSAQTVKLFEENNIKVLSSSEVYGI